MSARSLSWLASLGLLAACNGGGTAMMGNDAGIVIPPDTGAACANHIPNPPTDPDFGTLRGSSFQGFTLNRCDGTPFDFYGESYCSPEHTFTVISIAAGWCHPCQVESDLLTSNVVNVYGPLGVRVVQILVQDENGNPPDAAFCDFWTTAHGLTVAPNAAGVGNYELLDPAQITNRFFPDNALPSTIIIDSDGVIRFWEDGASESLASMTAELDRLLGR